MKYTVEKTMHGQPIDSDNGHGRTYAMQLARKMAKTCQGDEQVFISWFRPQDGQHGYLNPDGSHGITGQAWKKESDPVEIKK